MQWRSGRSSSPAAKQEHSVNALLQASRLAQRKEGSSKRFATPTPSYSADSYSNPGLLFQNSEDVQIASKHRRQTAGPIPQSWSKEIVDVKKAISARRARRNIRVPSEADSRWSRVQAAYRPTTLKDECVKLFLTDMAGGGPLLDQVAFLPMHIKMRLLELAPRVAPLNDASLDALLLEAEDLARADADEQQSHEPDAVADWESTGEDTDLPPERKIETLDLSYSGISLAMFRQVMVQESSTAGLVQPILRLPKLRSLDLSSSSLSLTAALLTVLSHAPLRTLAICNLSCSLYLPLQSIALALPTLQYLDVSHSDWLDWSHLAKLDWQTLFPQLSTLVITGCEGLSPNASFMDPEGRAGGPAVVMQAISTIKEAGRVRWLDIVA